MNGNNSQGKIKNVLKYRAKIYINVIFQIRERPQNHHFDIMQ